MGFRDSNKRQSASGPINFDSMALHETPPPTVHFNGNLLSTLNAHEQDIQQFANMAPSGRVGLQTYDGLVEGGIYSLGNSNIFIGQKVVSNDFTIANGSAAAAQTLDVRRTLEADLRGEWFEHVYPLGIDDPIKLVRNSLSSLIRYAKERDAYFVGAIVAGSCVLMPAVPDKRAWSKNGASQRYGQYANLTDSTGAMATKAMLIIDPGEQSGYANSEQIGVMDADIPFGQLEIDADVEGMTWDTVSQVRQGGLLYKEFKAAGNSGTGFDSYDWEYFMQGDEVQRIPIGGAQVGRGWQVPQR